MDARRVEGSRWPPGALRTSAQPTGQLHFTTSRVSNSSRGGQYTARPRSNAWPWADLAVNFICDVDDCTVYIRPYRTLTKGAARSRTALTILYTTSIR